MNFFPRRLPTMKSRVLCAFILIGNIIISLLPAMSAVHAAAPKIPIKAVIITMFPHETQAIVAKFGPWHDYAIPGLRPELPYLHCNGNNICVFTTGMGYANAGVSVDAVQRDPRFDFRHTYFIVAGIAGINPKYGTIGTAAWAHYLVDVGLQWEIAPPDAPGWPAGYLGIDAHGPYDSGSLDYKTELATLNPELVAKAYNLSKNVTLSDDSAAKAWRAHFPFAPANQPPHVTECDVASSDTYWSGTLIGERAEQWTRVLTRGQGKECMTAQEDNATYEALKRGQAQGLVDLNRVLVLRSGSDFDRPYPGLSDQANLLDASEEGGYIAANNLAITLAPVLADMTQHWNRWA